MKVENERLNKVAVLKGGISAEREVSLESGAAIAAGLRGAGYDVTEVDVQNRDFSVPDGVEAVFIALHGTFGEDGGAQARLEELGISYVGAGVEASRIAFDKLLTEQVLKQLEVPVPGSEVLRAGQARTLPLPVAVKPPREGSSVGCHLVFEEKEWNDAVSEALTHDEEVLVQQFIPGREFTVGIVDREVLPVVEIVPEKGWYDYAAKYKEDTTRYVVPAELGSEKTAEMQAIALKTFDALGARGFGRVDFRMTPEGELFVLELNTIPGFTSHSLLPKAAQAAGIEFPALCSRIMQTACL
ncbi:D-alanine--D-alanine ligase [Tichowtungia aerotolerans]|uniref:D-alanine--D-alanine ligase n=1 Tax=Tichowtungia aerotolerans TaxID=2697043 RepID=A0A6P1M892_9BACT|nr:D-alanine--D-alanine ligase [Tichowtungia aerotolerans]QHI70091.1 D-alanine--D-alanine ligase [Tichowtungia aerotolerans]